MDFYFGLCFLPKYYLLYLLHYWQKQLLHVIGDACCTVQGQVRMVRSKFTLHKYILFIVHIYLFFLFHKTTIKNRCFHSFLGCDWCHQKTTQWFKDRFRWVEPRNSTANYLNLISCRSIEQTSEDLQIPATRYTNKWEREIPAQIQCVVWIFYFKPIMLPLLLRLGLKHLLNWIFILNSFLTLPFHLSITPYTPYFPSRLFSDFQQSDHTAKTSTSISQGVMRASPFT